MKEVKAYLQSRVYPSHIQSHNQKSNFRRQCKPFYVDKGTLYYRREQKNASLEKEKDFTGSRKVILGQEKRKALIKAAHEGLGTSKEATAMSAHQGRDRCYEILRRRYYWPDMYNQVAEYCSLCIICQKVNPAVLKVREYLQPVPVPKRVMAQIGLDLTKLPEVDGFNYLIVAIDYFSKWAEARPLKTKTMAEVARFIYEDIVCRHGCVEVIITDRGREFNNELLAEEIYKLTNTKPRVTRAYHPQANGMIERLNGTVKNGVLKVVEEDVTLWPEVIPGVLFAYRAATQRSTKYSPFFLMYQRQPRLPMDFLNVEGDMTQIEEENGDRLIFEEEGETEEVNMAEFNKIIEFSNSLRGSIHDAVMKNIKKAQEDQTVQYNKKHLTGSDFHVGQLVLLVNARRQDRKGDWQELPRTGPYKIIELNSRKGAKLENMKGNILKTVYPIKRLYPFRTKENMANGSNGTEKAKLETPNMDNNCKGKEREAKPNGSFSEKNSEGENADIKIIHGGDADNDTQENEHIDVVKEEKPENENDGKDGNRGSVESSCPPVIILNGNKTGPVIIDGSAVKLTNTCAFDALLQSLAAAYSESPQYKELVDKHVADLAPLDAITAVKELMDGGLLEIVYLTRGKVLLDSFKPSRAGKTMTINCHTNIGSLLDKGVSVFPTAIEVKTCDGRSCPVDSMQETQRYHITLGVPDGGIQDLQQKVDAYFDKVSSWGGCLFRVNDGVSLDDPDVIWNDKALRCSGTVKITKTVGAAQLFLEIQDKNTAKLVQCELCLKDVPTSLDIAGKTFHLRGVVEYIGSRSARIKSIGHYKAHVLYGGKFWVCDDLVGRAEPSDISIKIRSHMLIYTI